MKLEFIPEEIWEKNKAYTKENKILWFQLYEEVWEFCELEDLNYRPYFTVK